MKSNLKQIVSDDKGRLSSTRLISLVTTLVITICLFLLIGLIPEYSNKEVTKEYIAMANSSALAALLTAIVDLVSILAALAGVNYAVNKTNTSLVIRAEAQNKEKQSDGNTT